MIKYNVNEQMLLYSRAKLTYSQSNVNIQKKQCYRTEDTVGAKLPYTISNVTVQKKQHYHTAYSQSNVNIQN